MAVDAIQIRQVVKRFGRHRALKGVSLDLRAGSVCALLGPNGAGKSTLLGILSTLVKPTGGEITYLKDDVALGAGPALRQQIGVLAHDSFIYSGLTALENLQFWGRLYRLEDVGDRASILLRRVGLDEEAWTRPAGTLSRGMTQRLSLARALLADPRVLLLDEPFSGLDRAGVTRLVEALRTAKGEGKLVLVVSHDLDAVAEVTDHLAVLERGKLAFEERQASFEPGALRELYHRHTEKASA